MSEAAAEKETPWGWIIFWIFLGLLAIGGIWFFFFSEWSKKRKLVKQIIKKSNTAVSASGGKFDPVKAGFELDEKKLMEKDIATLTRILESIK